MTVSNVSMSSASVVYTVPCHEKLLQATILSFPVADGQNLATKTGNPPFVFVESVAQ